jgi:hypothetical protein
MVAALRSAKLGDALGVVLSWKRPWKFGELVEDASLG